MRLQPSSRTASRSSPATQRMSGAIRRVRPLRTRPGPTSMAWRQPSRASSSMHSCQRTGLTTWRTSSSLTRPASVQARASTLVITGQRRGATVTGSNALRRCSAAGAIRAQWNGALTANGITRFAPLFLARVAARSTASRWPAITIWPPPFRFAGLTTWPSAACWQIAVMLARSKPSDRRHAPDARRHRSLHGATALADQAQGVGKQSAHRQPPGR